MTSENLKQVHVTLFNTKLIFNSPFPLTCLLCVKIWRENSTSSSKENTRDEILSFPRKPSDSWAMFPIWIMLKS